MNDFGASVLVPPLVERFDQVAAGFKRERRKRCIIVCR